MYEFVPGKSLPPKAGGGYKAKRKVLRTSRDQL
jgi:hypothetical protein